MKKIAIIFSVLFVALPSLSGCFGAKVDQGNTTAQPSAITTEESTLAAPTETQEVSSAPAQTQPAETQTVTENAAPETAPQTTEAPETQPPETEPAAPVSTVTSTPEEIVAFYADAVNDIRANGSAGYTKKEFKTMRELRATGNAEVDKMIGSAVGTFIKDEAHAEAKTYAKGTEEAKANISGWALTDPGKVVSAALSQTGGDYTVTIRLADEDTPHKGASFLAQVGTVLLWEDFENDLKKVSFIKEYTAPHVLYTGYTITAVLSPEGMLRSVEHRANVALSFGSVKLPFIGNMNGLSIELESAELYGNFTY